MAAISVFDMIKIGVGPSSSHTMGPWRAALAVVAALEEQGLLTSIRRRTIYLYGSLAKTGKGHGTNIALLMGLMGEDPVSIDTKQIRPKVAHIRATESLLLNARQA
jgi:L-serine dehydratase